MAKAAAITKISVSDLALKQEEGRRRNNKKRAEKVRPKAYYFAALAKPDFEALRSGGKVVKTFNSGRVVELSLK